MDILVHIFRSSGIRVCLSRFCCQRFSNRHSVCQRLIQVLSIWVVRRFVLVVGGFLYVQSTRGFSIKRFLQVLFFFFVFFFLFFFVFVGLHVVSGFFFQVLYVCQSFGFFEIDLSVLRFWYQMIQIFSQQMFFCFFQGTYFKVSEV